MAERISMPAGFGGLLRYDEEYRSKFLLKPAHVIGFVIAVILFVSLLRIFRPV